MKHRGRRDGPLVAKKKTKKEKKNKEEKEKKKKKPTRWKRTIPERNAADALHHRHDKQGSEGSGTEADSRDPIPASNASLSLSPLPSNLQPKEGEEERRIDTSDGNMYAFGEFVSFYGAKEGKRVWDASLPASRGPPRARPHDAGKCSGGDGGGNESDAGECVGNSGCPTDNAVDDVEENRQAAAEEIEALRSIYGAEAVETKVANRLTVRIENDVKGRPPLYLTVTLPESYPSRALPLISLFADWMTEEQKADALANLMAIGEQECGCPILFTWTEWLKENVEPPPPIQNAEDLKPTDVLEQPSDKESNSQRVILGRRLIYSHHIIAQSKRAAVSEWAQDLQLGGFFKIGWPGAIIVEGREADLQEYVRSLKRLTWKHLAVRGVETVVGRSGQSIDDLRVLPKTMTELGEDGMSQFANHCKAAGLHDLFLTLIKRKQTGDKKKNSTVHEVGERKKDTTAWISGEPFVDRKSTFQAHVIRISSREEAEAAMKRLLTNRKIARATHNISAYRFRTENGGIAKDYDDDGETAAGGRLLHLLDLSGALGMLVVVSRWYGGILLGPDRFRHINNAARTILENEGYISAGKTSKKSGGKKLLK